VFRFVVSGRFLEKFSLAAALIRVAERICDTGAWVCRCTPEVIFPARDSYWPTSSCNKPSALTGRALSSPKIGQASSQVWWRAGRQVSMQNVVDMIGKPAQFAIHHSGVAFIQIFQAASPVGSSSRSIGPANASFGVVDSSRSLGDKTRRFQGSGNANRFSSNLSAPSRRRSHRACGDISGVLGWPAMVASRINAGVLSRWSP